MTSMPLHSIVFNAATRSATLHLLRSTDFSHQRVNILVLSLILFSAYSWISSMSQKQLQENL